MSRYNKKHKIRFSEWLADGLPVDHLFSYSGADTVKLGHDYFKRKAVEARCAELKVYIAMGAVDACHLFLLDILCPSAEEFRPAKKE